MATPETLGDPRPMPLAEFRNKLAAESSDAIQQAARMPECPPHDGIRSIIMDAYGCGLRNEKFNVDAATSTIMWVLGYELARQRHRESNDGSR